MVELSRHFGGRKPSAIRSAQILFEQRSDRDSIHVVNTAIGNVSLPMHPAMQERMNNLMAAESPFAKGVVRYTPSVGTQEARAAFLHIIASAGFSTNDLHCLVTDGGSLAMELMILGVCGPASKRPLLLLEPAYTNYVDMAKRNAVPTVAMTRTLNPDGAFTNPDFEQLSEFIRQNNPAGIVIIPTDNPTGQFLDQAGIETVAKICVEHDIWIVSDEAYRQLHYRDVNVSSVWGLTEKDVPGITGRRISIESASKVWNACGLRVGALVTDNEEFHKKAVAEYTANLSGNAIGQYIYGAIASVPHDELRGWYDQQRKFYAQMMQEVVSGLREALPGVIVSNPDASLYSVIDVRNVASETFDSAEFVTFCAERGRIDVDGEDYTLLVSPMAGFYANSSGKQHGRTQMRLAYVEPPDKMRLVPQLFSALFGEYTR